MSNEELADELLRTAQATRLFLEAGLSETTFRQRIKDGDIHPQLPEGRKRGAMYPLSEVQAAIAKSRVRKKKRENNLKPSTFHQATVDDMPEIAELLRTFYSSINPQKRAAWIERNKEVCYILRSEGKVVACAFIMPLNEDKLMQILTSQAKPPTRPGDIPLYEAGKHYLIYARAVGVLQSVSKEQKKHWAAKFIAELAKTIIALGARGIFIDKIYAQGDSRSGEKALRALGFCQVDLNAPTSRKNYELDMMRSGSPLAMAYKHELYKWRAMNEDE